MATRPRSLPTVDVTRPEDRDDGNIALTTQMDMKDITKELPRRVWTGAPEYKWLVPAEDLQLVVEHYRQHGIKVLVNGIDQELMSEMRDRVPNLCNEDLEDRRRIIPSETWARLLPFQQEGVNFGIQRRGRLLLADEPGLGKTVQFLSPCGHDSITKRDVASDARRRTIGTEKYDAPTSILLQAILIVAAFHDDWPLLIVCPAAMRKVWENHLMDWLPRELISPGCVRNIANKKEADALMEEVAAIGRLREGHITIVSYDQLQNLGLDLRRKHKAVIVDESHMVKTSNAERTRAVRAVAQQAETRILISGTPMESRPIELYSQLNMVRPALLGSRDDFGKRYCGGQKTEMHRRLDYWGKSNQEEMHAVLRETILLRRNKADVLTQLPDKFRCWVPVEISGVHRQELAELRRRMGPTPSEQHRGGGDETLVNELRVETGLAKVDGSIAHLMDVLASGRKVIFFAHHKAVLDKAESALAGSDHKYIRIDGSTSAASRHGICEQFQTQKEVKVALLSIKATGVGVTLTAAEVVIFAELDWNPTALEQAEDRAHRVGQTKALQAHYIVATDPSSADELMRKTIERKLKIIGQAVDGKLHGETGLQMGAYQPPLKNADPILSTPEKEPSDQHRALGSQEMPDSPARVMASPPDPTEQGPTQPRVCGSQERDASPRGVKASQEKEAPGAPKKKRLKKASLLVVLSDDSDSDAEMGGRRAAKAVGPDYDSFTVEGMVRHKRSVAAKNESQKGTGEAELIDLTQESQEGSQPRRTTQFSREEQGPLADEDD